MSTGGDVGFPNTDLHAESCHVWPAMRQWATVLMFVAVTACMSLNRHENIAREVAPDSQPRPDIPQSPNLLIPSRGLERKSLKSVPLHSADEKPLNSPSDDHSGLLLYRISIKTSLQLYAA